MKAGNRLTLILAVLIGIFVLGVAVAVGTLLTLQSPDMAAVAAVALVAGVLAAGITYLVAKAGAMELDEDLSPPGIEVEPIELDAPHPAVRSRQIPEADLPAPYLAAVMKGLQASRAAMRPPLH
jgi:hypothetical protein